MINFSQFVTFPEEEQPQEQTGFDFKPFVSDPVQQPQEQAAASLGDDFARGLSSGTDNLQATLYGLGQTIGLDKLNLEDERFALARFMDKLFPEQNNVVDLRGKSREKAASFQEGVDRNTREAGDNAPTVNSLTDIEDTGDFFHFAAGALGNATPSLALSITGGGIGAAIAKRVVQSRIRNAILTRASVAVGKKKGIKKAFTRMMAKPETHRRMIRATMKGSGAGAFAASSGPQIGDIHTELKGAGFENDGLAVAAGLVGGALDALPVATLMTKLFPGIKREVAKSWVKDVAKTAGMQFALEGSTEGAQEVVALAAMAYEDPSFDLLSPVNRQRVLDAVAQGAIVGAITGGFGSAVVGASDRKNNARNLFKEKADLLRVKSKTMSDFVVDSLGNVQETRDTPDFEESAFPDFADVRKQAADILHNTFAPVVQGLHQRAAQATEKVGGAFSKNGQSAKAGIAAAVDSGAEFLRGSVGPELKAISQTISDKLNEAFKASQNLSTEDRKIFLDKKLSEIKTFAQSFSDEKIKPLVKQAEAFVANRLDSDPFTADFDEETLNNALDLFEDSDNPINRDTPGVVDEDFEAPIQQTFGMRSSQGEDAVPWVRRKSARGQLARLKKSFPGVADSQWEIQKVDGGYVINIRDSEGADSLFTSKRFNDGVDKAIETSRQRDTRDEGNAERQIKIRKKGSKKYTAADLPTLIFLGKDLIGRKALDLVGMSDKNLLSSLAEIISSLDEHGYEIEGNSLEQLNKNLSSKAYLESLRDSKLDQTSDGVSIANKTARPGGQTVGKTNQQVSRSGTLTSSRIDEAPGAADGSADIRADKDGNTITATTAEETTTEQRDSEPVQDRVPDDQVENLGDQNEAAERQRANQDDRTYRGEGRDTTFRNRLGTKGQVHVSINSLTKESAKRIQKFIETIAKALGLKSRIILVDENGIQLLLDSGKLSDSMNRALKRTLLENPKGRVHMEGGDAVIFIQKKQLQGNKRATKNREATATKRTFAIIGHELGHIVKEQYFNNLSPKLQERLRKAHRNANEDSGRDQVFDEWMADQLVGWIVREKRAKNAVDSFFKRLVGQLRKIYNELRKVYGLDGEFKEFIDGVVAANKGQAINEVSQHFIREAGSSFSNFTLPLTVKDFEMPGFGPMTSREKRQILKTIARIKRKYPNAIRGTAQFVNLMGKLHDQVTSSLVGRLRRIPGGDILADVFHRAKGNARGNQIFGEAIAKQRRKYSAKFAAILHGMSDTEVKDFYEAMQIMNGAEGEVDHPKAAEFRKVFDELYDYMIEAGLPVKKIPNYFPRVYDQEKLNVRGARDKMMRHLLARGMKEKDALRLVDHLTDPAKGFPADDLLEIPSEKFIKNRSKWLDDEFFDQFLSDDPRLIMKDHVNLVVKRAEFNRVLGHDSEGDAANWAPLAKLNSMLQQMRDAGATQEELDFAKDAVDAMLGRYGRDSVGKELREGMGWLMTYQNVRHLLFTVFASFPDMAGPAIRSNNAKQAFKVLKEGFSEIVDKESDLNQMARAWDIISDKFNQHILAEQFDTHWLSGGAREVNEKFFKWTGLNAWTNFTRSAALAVGVDFIKSETKNWFATGDAKSKAKLAELGLTAGDVQTWIDNGEPVWGDIGYREGPTSAADEKVADAMIQFVNESIMRPTPSQRPLWSSNQAFLLLFHLKSYMYSFHDTVSLQILENVKQAGTPKEKAYALAMPAAMLLAFTAMGLELRELIQYKVWGRAARTDRMDGLEYMSELVERSGILGPSQLAIDWDEADRRGQHPLIAMSGPTLSQVNDFISKPLSQTVPKAIPIVSQIPKLRYYARDILHL